MSQDLGRGYVDEVLARSQWSQGSKDSGSKAEGLVALSQLKARHCVKVHRMHQVQGYPSVSKQNLFSQRFDVIELSPVWSS